MEHTIKMIQILKMDLVIDFILGLVSTPKMIVQYEPIFLKNGYQIKTNFEVVYEHF